MLLQINQSNSFTAHGTKLWLRDFMPVEVVAHGSQSLACRVGRPDTRSRSSLWMGTRRCSQGSLLDGLGVLREIVLERAEPDRADIVKHGSDEGSVDLQQLPWLETSVFHLRQQEQSLVALF